ncbi:NADPH-dependent FMN reductase [Spongisporangium articulatum]|uniref:NADPH-dependent FMN reductase n=1 Tax=Spongisporangium articulatum TaxID=3362603 RepID=A0ABW8AHK6_9ACTN
MTSTTSRLAVVIASARPGRVGHPVGTWIAEQARAHGGFDVDVVDLAELDLPLMNEPNHPRLRDYVHDHTKAWSATVDAADAFVFVFPEYNHGMTAPLKNALDYLHEEWAHKPAGLVSYGGVSAGLRAAQQVKQVLAALKITPLTDAVMIPFVGGMIDGEGAFAPSDMVAGSAKTMLDELARQAPVLAQLRA